MNTAGSVLYGWGVLIVAGAGSYYFAKKSIDERRKGQERSGGRPKETLSWQERIAESEALEKTAASARALAGNVGNAGKPPDGGK